MKLNDEQNLAFMSDPRRVAAEKELHDIVHSIQTDIKFDGNAHYYLTVLPPLLKKLADAYENLNIVEATVQAEILGKERYHA